MRNILQSLLLYDIMEIMCNKCTRSEKGYDSGADPGFPVRGAHLKKMRRAEGRAKILGYFV